MSVISNITFEDIQFDQSEQNWNETPNHKLNIETIDNLEQIGKPVGKFLEMTYREAMTAVKKVHKNAKYAIGLKLLPGRHSFLSEYIYAPDMGEWGAFQHDNEYYCGSVFTTVIYAIPQKYKISI